ncbi:MAG: PH domain-containing protein [Acidobacteriota bacterium]|nr:MAG: PH domain-containing protein [Acidobacteriota bacterium]
MYCNKCGTENADEAVFCQKCGKRFEVQAEEETLVAQKSGVPVSEDEETIFSIRPTLIFVGSGYVLAVIGGILLAVLLGLLGVLFTNFAISSLAVVVVCLSLLLIPAYHHIKQKMIRYTLTDSKIEIDEGLINKTTRNVPLRIIQDVTVSANAFQRMLGFGNIEIENANENDSMIVLKNINSPKKHAEQILRQMRLLNK